MNPVCIWEPLQAIVYFSFIKSMIFAIACEHESTTNILLDMLDNELMLPFKHMGLLDMCNGLNAIQTKDFIKIICTTNIECISAKHLTS